MSTELTPGQASDTYSPDGVWWWDGWRWQPAYSVDGRHWWDGSRWVPVMFRSSRTGHGGSYVCQPQRWMITGLLLVAGLTLLIAWLYPPEPPATGSNWPLLVLAIPFLAWAAWMVTACAVIIDTKSVRVRTGLPFRVVTIPLDQIAEVGSGVTAGSFGIVRKKSLKIVTKDGRRRVWGEISQFGANSKSPTIALVADEIRRAAQRAGAQLSSEADHRA